MLNPATVPDVGLNQFPDDTALPQLRAAADPDLMAGIFRRHLRARAGRAFDITHCRLSRVSYLRGDRCVLRYMLRLVDRQGGRERSQWVVGAIDAGERAYRHWRKLESTGAGEQLHAEQMFEPVSYVPELKMLVQVFPFDRGLPTLPLMIDGPPPALEMVLLDSLGAGPWHAEGWTVEPLEYGPGSEAVLRYTVQARCAGLAATSERRYYVKVYADRQRGARAHRLLEALRGAADARARRFEFCRPVAYSEDLAALVLEEARGTSLRQIILGGRGVTAAMRQSANAMVSLHLSEPPTECHTLEEEISHKLDIGARIQMACPHLGPAIAEVVNGLAAGLPEMPPCPTHRSMKLDHILIDGGKVVFIDLDSYAGTDPVLDPAALLAQLAAISSLSPVPQRRARRAAQVFAEEYFAHVPHAWRSRLPVHYAGALLVNACGLFRSQTQGWSATIARLVEEARQSLAGRVW